MNLTLSKEEIEKSIIDNIERIMPGTWRVAYSSIYGSLNLTNEPEPPPPAPPSHSLLQTAPIEASPIEAHEEPL